MTRWAAVLAALFLVTTLAAGDGAPPGRASVAGATTAQAWTVRWDTYRTWIVVGPAAGRTAPAWIVTWNVDTPEVTGLAVAYRATAYVGEDGWIHCDAREARIAGPLANNWSSDSFAIHPDGRVRTIDDQDRGHAGTVERQVPTDDPAFGEVLRQSLALAQDTL
jgi:hypothetical protein